MISNIIHFYIMQKFCKHFLRSRKQIGRTRQLTIQTFIKYLIYCVARKQFGAQSNLICSCYRNVSFQGIIICEEKYLNK